MVLFKINRLYDEIQRVYNEHYKDCKHQEVHDFYRAVMRRMRTTGGGTNAQATQNLP